MQIDNTFILVNYNFPSIEKNAIKSAKIIIKDKKHLIFTYSLKFNSA